MKTTSRCVASKALQTYSASLWRRALPQLAWEAWWSREYSNIVGCCSACQLQHRKLRSSKSPVTLHRVGSDNHRAIHSKGLYIHALIHTCSTATRWQTCRTDTPATKSVEWSPATFSLGEWQIWCVLFLLSDPRTRPS